MGRPLTPTEQALLSQLLVSRSDLQGALPTARVVDMADGGMDSLRFVGHGKRKLGSVLVEATSADLDAVPIEISINLDQHGELFEVDLWKVDFSAVQRFPQTAEIRPESART